VTIPNDRRPPVNNAQSDPSTRFPAIAREKMSDAQRQAYDALVAGPRGGARGPFNALLRSPDLMDKVQRVGEYVRFRTSIPARLNELAILVTGRAWGAKFEFYAHRILALKAGLSESIADAIARNERPKGMQPDEELVYDFATALHRDHVIDDALFKRAVATFGEHGVMDLIGVIGYYTLVSMVLNVAEVPLPPGEKSPF
jgi:4-carboxymuconolactone decarboxylase